MARQRRLCSSITFKEFESAAVGRGLELDIHRPHLMGMVGPVATH
jgi:hypothetical protein